MKAKDIRENKQRDQQIDSETQNSSSIVIRYEYSEQLYIWNKRWRDARDTVKLDYERGGRRGKGDGRNISSSRKGKVGSQPSSADRQAYAGSGGE